MWESLESAALENARSLQPASSILELEAGVHRFSNQCAKLHDGFVFVSSSTAKDFSVHADAAVDHFIGDPAAALCRKDGDSLDLIFSRLLISTLSEEQFVVLIPLLSEKLTKNGKAFFGYLPSECHWIMRAGDSQFCDRALLDPHWQALSGIDEPVRFWEEADLKRLFGEAGLIATAFNRGFTAGSFLRVERTMAG